MVPNRVCKPKIKIRVQKKLIYGNWVTEVLGWEYTFFSANIFLKNAGPPYIYFNYIESHIQHWSTINRRNF